MREPIAARLRAQCESLHRKPTPLADLIPLLQEAADEHDELVKALTRLCKTFPTDDDMAAADWTDGEINEACNAYDAARAVVAKATGGHS